MKRLGRKFVGAAVIGFLAAVLLVAMTAGQSFAQMSMSGGASCPSGNLLAGKKPVNWKDTRRNRMMLTDGKVTVEGGIWNASEALLFDTGAATVTWDLGRVVNVSVLLAQADANDRYTFWGSVDGRRYEELGKIGEVKGHGLRRRALNINPKPVRFIRFGEGYGDRSYSATEVMAYCQMPTEAALASSLKVVDAKKPKVTKKWWNNETSVAWEMILAIAAFLLLLLNRGLRKDGKTSLFKKARTWALATMGGLALLSYFNFGSFHFNTFVHDWDTFHYYVGAKYFDEMEYERLYECIAVVEAENPKLRKRVETRTLMNLRTNIIESTADILAHPERCKKHFTPARWEAFRKDIAFFRKRVGVKRWDNTQTDHGFNASPVWMILGTTLANTAAASESHIFMLDLIDVAYFFATLALIFWAFGWRALAVALIVFATNFPGRYYWTGGSFLRWDWLFYMAASVCFMRKKMPFAAGAVLAYAMLLRLFPGFLFLGPGFAFLYTFFKDKKRFKFYLRFALGAARHRGCLGANKHSHAESARRLRTVLQEQRNAQRDAFDELHGGPHHVRLPPFRNGA